MGSARRRVWHPEEAERAKSARGRLARIDLGDALNAAYWQHSRGHLQLILSFGVF